MPRKRVIIGRQTRRTVILGEAHAAELAAMADAQGMSESDVIRRLIMMAAAAYKEGKKHEH